LRVRTIPVVVICAPDTSLIWPVARSVIDEDALTQRQIDDVLLSATPVAPWRRRQRQQREAAERRKRKMPEV